MEQQNIIKGNKVKFYDCFQVSIDKDASGTNPKHYPIGIVDKVYIYHSIFGYSDQVCDIKIGNRISRAHFTNCVTKIPN